MSDHLRQKFVPAVQNATVILRLLASQGQPMGATQIARETGLNVSSAFNILRTLTHEGLVSFDPLSKNYLLGMGIMEFAAPLLGANPTHLIRPLMNEIAQEHQVMIALWQITQNDRIVLIDRFTAERIVQAVISRNSRLPVFGGAIWRVYAAAMNLTEQQTRAGYDTVRWQDAPGFESYWQDVQTARETGHAYARTLFRGLEFVATLACDAEGTPRIGMSSITIAGQQGVDSLAAVASSLKTAAEQIERGVFGRKTEP